MWARAQVFQQQQQQRRGFLKFKMAADIAEVNGSFEENDALFLSNGKVKTERKFPKNMLLKSQIVDIAICPTKDVIAAGKINGKITVCSFSKEKNKKLFSLKHHRKACRSLAFSKDGKRLFSASKDMTIQVVDMDTGDVVNCIQNAHESSIYRIKVISHTTIASGDENGCIKLWNIDTCQCVAEFNENEDFISDMVCDSEGRHLLCTSGDGTLTVINARSKKLKQRSDQMESELLSLAVVKNGSKVVCGDGDGTLNIFTWGRWGDMTDRFPGCRESIDAICKITEDIIIIGCADGIIRSVHIQPNQFLRAIGKYGDLPIERLQLSHDGNILVSCSHDNRIKFWDVCDTDEQMPIMEKYKKTAANRKRKTDDFEITKAKSFFSDM